MAVNIKSLAEIPFGRRGTRHMITQQGETLWLALASEAAPSLVPTEPRPAGLLEIGALRDGVALPLTYAADSAKITLTTDGGTAAITYDASINAFRIIGNGFTLRLDGKMPAGVSSVNKAAGTEVNMGGGKYFFVAQKGTISFDDTWVVNAFGSVTPILDLAPDANGDFDLVAYDLVPDTDLPVVTRTFDECVADNEAEFAAFRALLKTEITDELAYRLFVNMKKLPNGHWCVTPNRLYSATATHVDQALASLAFANGDAAIDVATSIAQASPPLLGYVSANFAAVSDASQRYLQAELDDAYKWWNANRFYPGGYYYAYRFETGLAENPDFKDNGYAPSDDLTRMMTALGTAYDPSVNYVELSDIDLTKYASAGLVADLIKEVL